MSEENIVTYADVVRFYADKDDTDEVAKGDYIDVAKSVWFAKEGKPFSEFIKDVNKKITSITESIRVLKECPSNDEEREDWRCFQWDNTFYDVHAKADDYVFGWLLVNGKQKKNNDSWGTIELYNKYKGNYNHDFYKWFIEKCDPQKKYRMGQKWHLFEYILYQEMNAEYNFSKFGKVDDLESEEFMYYKRAECPELILWMAEEAVCKKIEKARGKANELKAEGKYSSKICAELRKILPWSEIENIIKEGIVKNA